MRNQSGVVLTSPLKLRLYLKNIFEWVVWINDKKISQGGPSQLKTPFFDLVLPPFNDGQLLITISARSSNTGRLSFELIENRNKILFKSERFEIMRSFLLEETIDVIRKVGTSDANDFESLKSRLTKSGKELLTLIRHKRSDGINGLIKRIEGDNYIVPVFYSTDRNKIYENNKLKFGTSKGKQSFGICNVNIPKRRKVGSVNRPSWWKLQFKENENKHVLILDTIEEDPNKFFRLLKDYVDSREKTNILVFIHGFNVRFEAAAMRAAQIAFDTGFSGTTVLYSWPSAGSIVNYIADEENVQYSHQSIIDFIQDLNEVNPESEIFLMAHSLGNRALINALMELQLMNFYEKHKFNQVILAAPDIASDLLIKDAPRFLNSAKQLTLYASSNDKALAASRSLHNSTIRAGETNEYIIYINGVDTINASGINTDNLGHGYYASTEPLINDLHLILNHQLPPSERNLLRKDIDGKVYWEFRNN